MRDAQDTLSERNRQALRVYGLLAKRVVVDFGLEPLVFDALQLQLTTEDAALLVDSLDLIHTARCPLPTKAEHG